LKLPDLTEGGEDRDFQFPAITGSFGEILQVNQNFLFGLGNSTIVHPSRLFATP
jgi:hypothetical protein